MIGTPRDHARSGDGRVTWRDLIIEALAVLLGSEDPRYDINHDGRVSIADLGIVLRQIGNSCQPASIFSRNRRAPAPAGSPRSRRS